MTPVSLTASFDILTFLNWGGACAGSNPLCSFVMDGAKDVTATFTAAPSAMIDSAPFVSLSDAYTAAAISGSTTILTLDTLLIESLTVNKQLKIIGGYNATYTGRTGNPTLLQGLLTIGTGSLIVDGFAVR
jgi:hypothetical protein